MAEVKETTVTKETTVADTTVEEKLSPWYVFCSTGCGFCKKSEPIVEELNNEGYDILTLDLVEPDNQKLNQELKTKYKTQCGTPWFINAETGKGVCGFREKAVLEQWLKGEDVPEPPRPKGPPPRPPEDWKDQKVVDSWKAEYSKWREDNKHVPNIPEAEDTIMRIKKQQEMMAQRQAQGGAPGAPGMAGPDMVRIESKLDALINHLGVEWTNSARVPQQRPQSQLQKQRTNPQRSNLNQKSKKIEKQPTKR